MEAGVADGLDRERAALFALLGRLLSEAPDAALLARLRGLDGDGRTPLGKALSGLAAAAGATDADAAEREHFRLFIGVGRGELMPYASWYLTGFLHDRPLAELRAAGLLPDDYSGLKPATADAACQRRALTRAARSLLETYLAHSVGQEDLAVAHTLEAADVLARFARDSYRLPHQ